MRGRNFWMLRILLLNSVGNVYFSSSKAYCFRCFSLRLCLDISTPNSCQNHPLRSEKN